MNKIEASYISTPTPVNSRSTSDAKNTKQDSDSSFAKLAKRKMEITKKISALNKKILKLNPPGKEPILFFR